MMGAAARFPHLAHVAGSHEPLLEVRLDDALQVALLAIVQRGLLHAKNGSSKSAAGPMHESHARHSRQKNTPALGVRQ
jgi:hypothetical protein